MVAVLSFLSRMDLPLPGLAQACRTSERTSDDGKSGGCPGRIVRRYHDAGSLTISHWGRWMTGRVIFLMSWKPICAYILTFLSVGVSK